MKNIIILISVSILLINSGIQSQTSEYGNLEIYDRETSFSAFSYFSGSFPLSSHIPNQRMSVNGMTYSHIYDVARIGSLVPSSQIEINFMLKGIFKIGGGFGTSNLYDSLALYPNQSIKYYMLNVDFFTLSFQPEITYVFNDGYATTLYLGLDFLNIGGSGAILESGDLKKHTVGVINVVPLGFRPGAYFDFGRSALGISFYINSTNFFEYRILSKDIYPGISGAQSSEAFVRRFEFQILYTF